jgi:hypothetical protein
MSWKGRDGIRGAAVELMGAVRQMGINRIPLAINVSVLAVHGRLDFHDVFFCWWLLMGERNSEMFGGGVGGLLEGG